MVRVLDSLIAVALFLVTLPVFLIGYGGLKFSQIDPVIIKRDSRLVFNTQTCFFGTFLERLSIVNLPTLIWVIFGKTRLAELRR